MSAENVDAAQVADLPKPDEGHRVYVGNLSFTATEEDIRQFVAKAGGEILSVTLPLRFGRRPAGYAFVSYKNEEDAKKVVEELNNAELGDRKLKLEIAKPAEEVLALRQAKDEKRKEARTAQKAAKAEAAAAKKEAGGATTDGEVKEGETEAKPKSKKKKAKKPRRRLPEEGEEAEAETEAAGDASETSKPKSRKKTEARIDVNGEEGEKKERAPRPKRERKPKLELTGEESKSTIFVANLPFSVDDEALAAIFTNLSIKVKTAKVVQGIRRARPGSKPFRASKGFGFVEVEDESQQAEAVEKVEGTLIGDRQITAKIAKEMKPIEIERAVEAETAAS